ncbi:oxidoreductase [Ruegeria sp. HKCCD8929]|uniref:oxidoreductase n=1 Tax=Ruegeria sp. HKCCD8929 TaxID=2683006 RepID=UPI0014879C5D|nr:oxidoreductase [Ruegeria sp. HKCCD8929]
MNTQPQKIAIVTGANNGIGFETAAGMAEAGYHVVMACRSLAKAEAARDELIAKLPSASLDIILLDLGDFSSVQRFAEDFRARYEKLDVLINNAGILLYSAQTNGGGIELQFATNHLGHFLLTALLIDLMPDDPASRIVALSSLGHKGASIHFDDLTCGGDGGIAYGQSKLACLLFGDELDRRLRASGRKIKALSVHPGGSDSGLFTDMSDAQRSKLKAQVEQFLHSNASAAKPALHAALSPDVKGGDYYGPTGAQEMSGEVGHATRDPITGDLDVAGRLWSVSEELTGKTFSL